MKAFKRSLIVAAIISLVTMLTACADLGLDLNMSHTHSYDQKDTSFNYLKTEADCENRAEYFYSCSCGAKGTETFVYGQVAAHPYSTEWSYDVDAHWHGSDCSHEVRTDISTHDWNSGTVTVTATETREGQKTFKCVVCGAEKIETIPKVVHTHTFADGWSTDANTHWHAAECGHEVRGDLAVHSWDDGVVISAPTESSEGKTKYVCVICGYEKIKTVPAIVHEHTYNEDYSSDEYVHWYAASCGHDIKVSLAVHSWDKGTVVTAPTESAEGATKYVCVICGYEKTETVPAIPHTHTYESGWTSDAYVHWNNADCGHDLKANVSVHNWDNGVVVTAPTESAEGETKYTCVICGYEKTSVIPALPHEHTYSEDYSSDENVHWYAASCGHDIKVGLAVHSWDGGVVVTDPTESAEGATKYTCVICGYEKTEITPTLTHTHSYENEWSNDAYSHWNASDCGHELKANISVHTWDGGVVVTAPTESAEGATKYTCVICGYEKTEITPAIPHIHTYGDEWASDANVHWNASDCGHDLKANVSVHSWDDGVVVTAPTESSEGTTKYTCVICGYERIKATPTLEHKHTYSAEWTSNEYLHWHAASCGHNERNEVSAHIWGEKIVTTPATEDSTGLYTFNCVICGYEKTEIIPKLTHTHVFDNKWSADEDTHWIGTTCGHDIKSDIAVHVWDNGTIVVEPTEDEEGEMLYKCLICKTEKTKTISMVDHEHTYESVWSYDEYTHWYNADCGHDDKIGIAAHIFGESVVTVPATEDSTGVLTYKCVLCSAEKNETIPKLDHKHTYADAWTYNSESHWHVATCSHVGEVVGMSQHHWNNGVITVSPTDTTDGEITYTCIVCEYYVTEVVPALNHVHSFTIKTTNYLHLAADCTHKATYYYSCVCGEKGDSLFEYGDVASHRYVNYTADGNATCSEDGTKTAKCENCNLTNTIADPGSKIDHTYSAEWTYDDKYHWHVATCIHTDAKSDMGSHTWDAGVITLAPTEESEGIRLYSCTECLLTKEETVPKLEHVHVFNVKTNDHLATEATCQDKATYYYECACGAVGSETYEYGYFGNHRFVDYLYNNDATCSSDGTKSAICATEGCNQKDTIVAEGTKLPHKFIDTWNSDGTYHWHDAICGHADQISGKEEHQWNGGVVIKAPTEEESGEKLYTCVICDRTKTETVPRLEHVHVFNQKTGEHLASAATCEHKATYYYTCACGEVGTATYEYGALASHKYSAYVSNNDATCGSDGTKTRICSACGHNDTVTDVGTKLPHTYADEWSYDANKHWHAATCDHTDARADEAAHSWDEGVITVQPTETTEGERLYTCSECNHTKTEIIPHFDHVHTFESEWSYDENKHWYAATCNHANERDAEADHDFVLHPEGSSSATVYEEGYQLYYCSVCNYEKEIVIPKLPAFTVIFYDSNYNVISETNYELGASVTVPTAPAKAGYRFIEWVSASESTTLDAAMFANAADNDVFVFNAAYLKEHTVTFVDNNGEVIDTIIVLDGQYIRTADLPEIPERVGYTAAWGSAVTASMVTEDMTIAPVYSVRIFDVAFLDKDGKPLSFVNELGESVTIQSVSYGGFAIIPDYPKYWFDATTLRLYEFTGWSADVDSITENRIGTNAVRALYEKEVDHPVIAVKITGKVAKISVTLPAGAEIFSLKLSAKWNNNNGLCGITLAQIETISSLNKDACGETLCTVGDKNGDHGWFTYNNKNNTFDFLWTCGNGHQMGAENVITITFESPSPAFVLDESIFEILSSSSVIYGDANASVTELTRSDVFVWFYE